MCGENRKRYRVLVSKPKGKGQFGLRRRKSIILKWVLKEQDEKACTRLIWFGTGTSGGLL